MRLAHANLVSTSVLFANYLDTTVSISLMLKTFSDTNRQRKDMKRGPIVKCRIGPLTSHKERRTLDCIYARLVAILYFFKTADVSMSDCV